MSNRDNILELTRDRIEGLIGEAARDAAKWGETEIGGTDLPVTFFAPPRPSRVLLLITKLSGLPREVIAKRPSDVAIVFKAGPIDPHTIATIKSLTSQRRCAVRFVGDLDPIDILNYLYARVSLQAIEKRIEYVGINERWLKGCRRFLVEPNLSGGEVLPLIQMHRDETEFARKLLQKVQEFRQEIGASATELLLQGYKLELEGASNLSLYRAGFERLLRLMLYSPAPERNRS